MAASAPVPARAGIGLRLPHLSALADAVTRQGGAGGGVPWVEIHSETFLCDGPRRAQIREVARALPISCHSVGLSLGSAEGLDAAHLAALRALYDDLNPALISDHLSFSVVDGAYVNDLLPLPMSRAALEVVCTNVARAQDAFGRRLLVENPSVYAAIAPQEMSEPAFFEALIDRTGCGLLLDVNNVYVSVRNAGGGIDEAADLLAQYPLEAVAEIHLATYTEETVGAQSVLIDTHSGPPCDAVRTLYQGLLARTGPVPTLFEWDTDVPEWSVLQREARALDRLLDQVREAA